MLGLGIAYVGAGVFNRAIVDTVPPFWIDVRLDTTVLAFVTATTVLAALWSPASCRRCAPRAATSCRCLNDEGRGTTSLKIGRLSRGLVIGEMALSFALLVVSGLVIQSILNVTRFDPGIATRDVLTARVTLPVTEYPDGPSRTRFADALVERLAAVPGVVRAGLTTTTPPAAAEMSVVLPGQSFPDERDYPRAHVSVVSEGYFEVLRLAPRQGRVFTPADGADAPRVAVVNETFQRLHYPEGAIGRQVRTFAGTNTEWHTIVGVVTGRRRPGPGRVDDLGDLPAAVAAAQPDRERAAAGPGRSAGALHRGAAGGHRPRPQPAHLQRDDHPEVPRRRHLGLAHLRHAVHACSAWPRSSWPPSASTA